MSKKVPIISGDVPKVPNISGDVLGLLNQEGCQSRTHLVCAARLLVCFIAFFFLLAIGKNREQIRIRIRLTAYEIISTCFLAK